jgi:hypothetical protein
MWVRSFRTRQCERARELASRRLDCELSELEVALLRAHQSRCHECGAFALSLGGFTRELRAVPLESPSRPVNLPRRRTALRSVQFAAAAAAVAAVAGVGSMFAILGSPGGPSNTPRAGETSLSRNLAEMRRLRRNDLAFTSSVIAPGADNQRILRLS